MSRHLGAPSAPSWSLSLAMGLLLLPLWSPPALAASVDAASKVQAVTVYPDRASVRRVARVMVPAGASKVWFKGLPGALFGDSVRVGGSGQGLTVLGSQLRRGAQLSTAAGLLARHKAEVQGLEEALEANRNQSDVHERQLSALRTAIGRAGSGLADQLSAGKAKVGEWSALMGYLQQQQQSQHQALLSLKRQQRQLQDQLTKARQALRKLEQGGGEERSEVVVELESSQGGWVELSVEYVVPGASWGPTYDARLDVAGNRFEWRAYGLVRQETGEDWHGVHLRLSTASPAAGSQPPSVPAWSLSHAFDALRAYGGMVQQSNRANLRNLPAMAPRPVAPGGARDEAAEEFEAPAPEPVALVRDLGTSTVLEVDRLADVPSDKEAHQLFIGRAPAQPSLSYRVVPRVRPEAYVQAEGVHPGPWPLLVGPVKAFVGGDYVGTTPLASEVLPGGRFTLAMGVDRGIQVRRQRVGKTTGTTGLLNRTGFADYRFEVAVHNLKATAQKVHVIEALPTSTQADWVVRVNEGSHRPEASSLPGQLHFVLPLRAGERQLLRWGYRVEWPTEGGTPDGLE